MTTDATACMDFETRSQAGHVWKEEARRWGPLPGAPQNKKGLPVVGAAAYAEHASTGVLTFSYELPLGWRATPWGLWPTLPRGPKQRWRPGLSNPQELFDYLAAGGTIEAHNVMFEWLIWEEVCVPKYGWPPLVPYAHQLRCSMAKARVQTYPGALGDLSNVLRLPIPKDKEGKRLLDKFSVPRNPTKADPRTWIEPHEDPADFALLQGYCDTDLDAEHGASSRMQPMSADELRFWLVDQEINRRGVGVDRAAVRDCIAVLQQALEQYGEECRQITGFDPTQLQALRGWLAALGVDLPDMREETITDRLALEPHAAYWRIEETPEGRMEIEVPASQGVAMPAQCRRVLEIRQLIGSASVKKLFAMENQATRDGRLKNLIIHHGARTGRPTGGGPQPLNLPKSGPELLWCKACITPYGTHHGFCPWCASPASNALKSKWPAIPKDMPEGTPAAIGTILTVMAQRDLKLVEWYFGDALLCISGCIRGLFIARPGYDLIASDFSSIEAVVGAELAGEQWRIDAFLENKPIYLVGASKITARPLQFYLDYFLEHGEHHPDRQYIGKVSELACLFGGWIGSYKAFGSEEPDDVIKAQILAWRAASPAVVEMWGGQWRGPPWDGYAERFGFEGAAVNAIQFPGRVFNYRGITFELRDHVAPITTPAWDGLLEAYYDRVLVPGNLGRLVVTLLSGRELTYHQPSLRPSTRPYAAPGELSITYWTWNSNPKYGRMGWVEMSTYGGRLTENIVQATAHDILRFSILNLRAAGYPCVLHVYDEIVCEIPIGAGSLAEFERIMAIMPPWAHDWPIRAVGGWRGRRYRKG